MASDERIETVDEVIAEWPVCTREWADRLTASLERDRAALLKVAEEMTCTGTSCARDCSEVNKWAAALRRAVGGSDGPR